MQPVTYVITITLRESRLDALLDDLAVLAQAARENRKCLGYDFFVTDGVPGQIILVQEWESEEDFWERRRTPAVQAVLARYEQDLRYPPTSTLLRATGSGAAL